ncbi:hypothetical protein RSOLAG1IB_03547 [Rhizoctonia solani AG-1 IB]|uniref:BAG domain-containing protein n=1 Tax=Thanatephorus cucumeris (strain AG1-IB / isolate 7/3/14) TaxID=1108050 RepID=A0A0B7FRX8_THACB|nr:hypothetical protein RSOLAG1IB_03547 [Rhizoctonia solani AG-1 IB]
MLVFASPVPATFSGLGALKSRHTIERPSVEEQYFQALAEEHERAAVQARQRLEDARRRQHQQREVEAQLLLQQQLAAVSQVRTPQRSPYQTPRKLFGRALPPTPDIIFEFDATDNDACDAYAERMHRRSQAAFAERQKRAQQQDFLRSLFEDQRRTQAERVAELHRKRVEEAKAEQERRRKAQEEAEAEQARRHLNARVADEEKLRQFFQALISAMNTAPSEPQGSDLERKNALRRGSVPAPSKKTEDTPVSVRAPTSAPTSPKIPERAPSPTPSVASDASDVSLNSIAQLQGKYESLRSGFTFPSNLVFAPTKGPITPASAPTLPYNPINAPVHAYENALTNLLTELDAVESFGDEHVRDVRRSLVKSVEAELETLEEKKRAAWRDQQDSEVAVPVQVEAISAPAEPVPVSVESDIVLQPEVESISLTIEPKAVPTPAPATDSPNPVSWLAARLSEAPESEDNEIKAVRENLLASLLTPAPGDEVVVAEPRSIEIQVEVKSVIADPVESEVTTAQPFEPTVSAAPEPSVEHTSAPTESSTEPTAKFIPEPELAEAHVPTPVSEPSSSESKIERATDQESPVADEFTSPIPELESALLEQAPETDIALAPIAESETSSTGVVSKPEALTKDEETSAPAEVGSTSTELKSKADVPAPIKETASPVFVQVYPDSDSDIDTDADLTSEIGEADKKSGDEFELI